MKRHVFPFTSIIGQESMKTALVLNAVDPTIGGVLISGHKGTGKSTAVRALSQILPPLEVVDGCPYNCSPDEPELMDDQCLERYRGGENLPRVLRTMPVVELPLSATEDRLVGTLHVEHALRTGERRFEPGLLAAANRGIMYVDEVNLLDDHLVDMLLDAAASGINVVEREGISFVHPARFILIGTMNPEEGELRPQFLDRFGLSVTVKGLDDMKQRQAVVRHRIAFEQSPEAFLQMWAGWEKLLADQIIQARDALPAVRVPDAMLDLAVRLSMEMNVHGHRSDIAILKSARALAALMESGEVNRSHIAEAARFVLPHRIHNVSLATPDALMKKIDAALGSIADDSPSLPRYADDEDTEDPDFDDIDREVPGAMAASNASMFFSYFSKKKSPYSRPMNPSASQG